MKYYLLNSKANNGILPDLGNDKKIVDAIGLKYKEFFNNLKEDDEVVLVGGDGTLNYFINEVDTNLINNNIYLYPCGTGNDFANDICAKLNEEVLINQYIKNLPTVYVNGMVRKFINGIGYGIDGYCCEIADQIKEKTPNAKINYTGIAIKGLLFHFKPCDAKICVDGKEFEYKNVWLAPAMKGRFYGGGMIISPSQDRLGETLSVVTYMSKSKIKALMAFPSIFKGEHIKKEDMVKIHFGNEISVKYSRPCALQIDGETVLNVSEYRVTK